MVEPDPKAEYLAMVHVMPPDGTVNEYAAGITGEVVTDALGRKHGCVAATVNGVERDLSTALHEDCNVTGISGDSDAGIHILRHSAAHLLAQAVTALYPTPSRPSVPPSIAVSTTISPWSRLAKATSRRFEENARDRPRNHTVERVELDEDDLREHFAHNPYKIEIIDDKLEDGDGSTIYRQGDWYDLCLAARAHHGDAHARADLGIHRLLAWRPRPHNLFASAVHRALEGGAEGDPRTPRGSEEA